MEENLKQQQSNCIKVVLFGPESSGKTTLAKLLAKYYKTKWVPEYSRLYAEEKLEDNKLLTKADILPIAIGQMVLENKIAKETSELLICDTNLLETKVYAEYIYNYCPDKLEKAIQDCKYDLYLLTDIDLPWETDPVRSSEDKRKEMLELFKLALKKYNLPYVIISGSKDKRLDKAINSIDKLLQESIKK